MDSGVRKLFMVTAAINHLLSLFRFYYHFYPFINQSVSRTPTAYFFTDIDLEKKCSIDIEYAYQCILNIVKIM